MTTTAAAATAATATTTITTTMAMVPAIPPSIEIAADVSEGNESNLFHNSFVCGSTPCDDRSHRHRAILACPRRCAHTRARDRSTTRHHIHLCAPRRRAHNHPRRPRRRPASALPAPNETVPGAAPTKDNDRLRHHHPSRSHKDQAAPLATGAPRDSRHCGRPLVRACLGGREGLGARHCCRGGPCPA
jgi:hypothetical protein